MVQVKEDLREAGFREKIIKFRLKSCKVQRKENLEYYGTVLF